MISSSNLRTQKTMKNLTRAEESIKRTLRQPRRSIFVAIATVLAVHPLNLPPVKLDFHVTLDTRPYAEESFKSSQKVRN
jgi:hypothetical protein